MRFITARSRFAVWEPRAKRCYAGRLGVVPRHRGNLGRRRRVVGIEAMRRLAMVMPVVFALSASPALGANTTTVDVGLNGSTVTQPDVTIAAADKIHSVWDVGRHTAGG